jgi:hypothetical protein
LEASPLRCAAFAAGAEMSLTLSKRIAEIAMQGRHPGGSVHRPGYARRKMVQGSEVQNVLRIACALTWRNSAQATRGNKGNVGKQKHTSTAKAFWKNPNCKAIASCAQSDSVGAESPFFSN